MVDKDLLSITTGSKVNTQFTDALEGSLLLTECHKWWGVLSDSCLVGRPHLTPTQIQ